MLKFETIYKRAIVSRDADTRRQARELSFIYSDRYRSTNEQIVKDTWSTDEYTGYLTEHGIDYVEIQLEKENGNQIKMVIPSLIFKNMTSADIGKLIKL